MRPRESELAQASAELVALVPLLVVCALALTQALAAGWTLLSAGEAARVAARVAHVGGDAEAAVRQALPSLLEPADVEVERSKVTVKVRAPAVLPGVPRIPIASSAALDPEGSP